MERSITLYANSIPPIIALLLFSIGSSGLDSRPSNRTCLAENITPRVAVNNAFPGVSFLSPLAMKQTPIDNTRFYVAEQRGVVQLIVNGVKRPTPFLDISAKVSFGGERGLLGLAFHPDYTANGYFYVSYTDSNGGSVVSRFTRSAQLNIADRNSESVVLKLSQPFSNHNGGNIAFGPDGYLYIGFGDGGNAGDPLDHAQDLSTWLGAMLRIDVDGGQPYAIPTDNPFAGRTCNQNTRTGICPEIYAYGLRNPWRWSFDSVTGDLWLGDVGQNWVEEIDQIQKGGNYGWRCFEGTQPYNPAGCDSVQTVRPVTQYAHSGGRCSVSGGYVYRGTAIADFAGYYLYGDFCTGEIWGLSASEPGAVPVLLTRSPGNIYSFSEDNQGNVYVLMGSGEIGRIDFDPAGGGGDPIPSRLSQTGCVDAADPSRPASGVIPYDINSPFWSDGASKSRWLALPDLGRIYNTSQDWYFPPGSVLMKQFELGGKLIETRLLKRHTNGVWAGYTYEWNKAGTDADRVINGKSAVVDNNGVSQSWVFPSESECMVCHTRAAGYALGPEPAQLNKEYYYSQTGRTDNQLNTALEIGLLANGLGGAPENLPKLSDPYELSGLTEQRARAWLHSNCAGCHRPGGGTNSTMDLRSTLSLSATNTCNQRAIAVGAGWPTILVSPGDPASSLLYYRANSRDPVKQMPPIGSTVADTVGMEAVAQWIERLAGCDP